MPAKFKQLRAKVPICWICDRMLWGGGRVYVEVTDASGHKHPAHKQCAQLEKVAQDLRS